VGYDAAAAARDASAIRDELTDRLVAAFEMETLVELVLNEELLKLGPPHKIPRVTKA
jgi:phenylacetate-CoA ligase